MRFNERFNVGSGGGKKIEMDAAGNSPAAPDDTFGPT
jgi:hypothetical protein